MSGAIRIGIGGWTYEPWRGEFYPAGLPQKQELAFASRAVNSIEINGSYYSTFKPASWRVWRDETPDGFVFGIKGSRFCTNRKVLASAGEAIQRFFAQGIADLGEKLGPINWQFAETKRFDFEDFGALLSLLPREIGGVPIRHAVEVSHASFQQPAFLDLAAARGIAVTHVGGTSFPPHPPTAGFTYARIKTSDESLEAGFTDTEMEALAQQTRDRSEHGDVFLYFVAGAKVRNPAAAQALTRKLSEPHR